MKKIFFYVEFQIKLNIAKAIYFVLRIFKPNKIIKIVRRKISWNIRLNDIVGLSIYLIGGFQLRKLKNLVKMLNQIPFLSMLGLI